MKNRVSAVKEFAEYSKSLLGSLSIHGLLLFFLIFGMGQSVNTDPVSDKPVEVIQAIQAVAVDETLVEAEMKRLQTEETKQKTADEERQKQISQKLEQLKRERQQEQAKLEQLKQDMTKAKQEEQARLADIKLAKEKEQKDLEALKIEKDKEKKKLAALDDERHAEQARIKQVQLEREKAERKKRELTKAQNDTKRKVDLNAAKEKERLAAENQKRIESEAQRVVNAWGEKIKMNKRLGVGMAPDLYCKLGISMLPDGSIKVQLVQSSGHPMHDDLAIKAAYKAQPFQLPEDPEVKEQTKYFEIGIRSDEGVG